MLPDATAVDTRFVRDPETISLLKAGLPDYVAKAADVSADLNPLEWWDRQEGNLPYRTAAVKKIILVQPSSAAAERVFSLLKVSFNDQQDAALQDYLEASFTISDRTLLICRV